MVIIFTAVFEGQGINGTLAQGRKVWQAAHWKTDPATGEGMARVD